MPDPYQHIRYRKNFLKEVLARVDFVSPLQGVDVALPPRLTQVAIKTFPIAEPRDTVQRAVEFGPQGIQSTEAHLKEWRFHGLDRSKTLTIGHDFVWIQHRAYQTYEAMKGDLLQVLDQVPELYPGTQPSRVGLRYVNSFELREDNPTDWSAYLAPELLSLFQYPLPRDRSALCRVFHNVELALDDYQCRFRLGMHNPDYPARIKQKVFVLDFDAFTQSAVDMRDVGHLLDRFHGSVQDYFEHSITNRIREIMNAERT